MYVFGGTVSGARTAMQESLDGFIDGCVAEFERTRAEELSESEKASWRNSWPELLGALTRARLGDLRLFLEYELPGTGQRVDALLLGAREDGGLAAIVVELKQWDSCEWADALLVAVRGREYTHPCRQAAGYVAYFVDWLDHRALGLEFRAVALLHNAPPATVEQLRDAVRTSEGSRDVAVLGRADVEETAGSATLAKALLSNDLAAPSDEAVARFLAAPHSPSGRVFDRLAAVLAGQRSFTLIGAQQDAQLHVLGRIGRAVRDRRKTSHLVVVRGGPGTGKTVIAARLLADIPRMFREVEARYLTPSGTLRWQLERAAADPAAKGLFANLQTYLGKQRPTVREVLLVDEAQRMKRGNRCVEGLLDRTSVVVLFLDERQIVNPGEGFTVEELKQQAHHLGARFTSFDLTSQFRCGGSQPYLRWLEGLLFDQAHPQWHGTDYDLGIAADPGELARWADEHVRGGHSARIAAGFCWPWTKKPRGRSLIPDVSISWTDPAGARRSWVRPWNAFDTHRDGAMVLAPRKEYWATDAGGENQVGCIYTCLGLEYDYAGVIMGPDVVRRGDRWVARPEYSHDPAMKDVSPDEYLRLAANTYWVLASRGARGCRLYSTDNDTQAYLRAVLDQ
ncbi:DNA/RNA helicase domain-containing protein [Lentzea sp. NPDC102401]|uniref:DNA/RNA helicase domain-containing protein n=1 Tax=Lentzea sp. NPDC102401 TaxID=3364128 RepID=UPI0038035A7A